MILKIGRGSNFLTSSFRVTVCIKQSLTRFNRHLSSNKDYEYNSKSKGTFPTIKLTLLCTFVGILYYNTEKKIKGNK